jgi:hypothetical protein
MKIIKKKQPEQLDEFFGRKKKPAPIPEKPGINHAWDKHYEMLEWIRKSGVNAYCAGAYLREGTNLSDEEVAEILCSWIYNYDELARYFHWKADDED